MSATPEPAPSGRRVRRVLHEGDPREAELMAAKAEVESIRSEMGRLRHRLHDLSRIEALSEHDSIALKVEGSLTLSIMALYTLMDGGDRSFQVRAAGARDLWADVAADPDAYVIEPGTSREAMRRGRSAHPSRSGRQFAGVPVCTDDGWGNEAFVEVTSRTETAETALAALIEADVYEWTDELDHDRIAPNPTRSAYKEGGDGDVPCAQDDPAKRGEYWIFDVSRAWK